MAGPLTTLLVAGTGLLAFGVTLFFVEHAWCQWFKKRPDYPHIKARWVFIRVLGLMTLFGSSVLSLVIGFHLTVAALTGLWQY